MGVGAMTDFGPLLANPRTLLLGAAAQFGIFATTVLGHDAELLRLFLHPAAGGGHRHYRRRGHLRRRFICRAAGPGTGGHRGGGVLVYGAGAVNQPPIMRADQRERAQIRMVQLRGEREKILFPVAAAAGRRAAAGMFCFGNLMRESGVVGDLSDTVQNGLINIVTIFLGLSVGAKLVADKFLQPQDAEHSAAGGDCVRYRDGGRGADGEAAEPVQ